MNRKNLTLAFLSKNYHPYKHFTPEMLKNAGDALRFFEIRSGETIHIHPTSPEDSLFVIKGAAYFSFRTPDSSSSGGSSASETMTKISLSSDQVEKQPVSFEEPIDISTDSGAIVCHVDSILINDFLSIKDISDASEPNDSEELVQRLMFLKSTKAFRMLPINAVEEVSKRCEEITVKKGDLVIMQDTRANDFFILLEGEAEVWREELEDDEPQMVALLGSGDTFGEEALIIGGARNASIKMITSGRLLKLSKADFNELVSTPALRSVSPEIAQIMVDKGAEIIDVRYEEEYQESFIPGSVLIPLPDLRNHIAGLDKDKEYLILCAAGLRASAAALLLLQQDVNAVVIEGGIKVWPTKTAKSSNVS